MSEDAHDYWYEKLTHLSQTEEWSAELERNGWQNEYRNGDEFVHYLEEQEKLITDLLLL